MIFLAASLGMPHVATPQPPHIRKSLHVHTHTHTLSWSTKPTVSYRKQRCSARNTRPLSTHASSSPAASPVPAGCCLRCFFLGRLVDAPVRCCTHRSTTYLRGSWGDPECTAFTCVQVWKHTYLAVLESVQVSVCQSASMQELLHEVLKHKFQREW